MTNRLEMMSFSLGHCVGSAVGGGELHLTSLPGVLDGEQHLQLRLQVEPIPRLHFNRCRSCATVTTSWRINKNLYCKYVLYCTYILRTYVIKVHNDWRQTLEVKANLCTNKKTVLNEDIRRAMNVRLSSDELNVQVYYTHKKAFMFSPAEESRMCRHKLFMVFFSHSTSHNIIQHNLIMFLVSWTYLHKEYY